jgi:hypothetical protein
MPSRRRRHAAASIIDSATPSSARCGSRRRLSAPVHDTLWIFFIIVIRGSSARCGGILQQPMIGFSIRTQLVATCCGVGSQAATPCFFRSLADLFR